MFKKLFSKGKEENTAAKQSDKARVLIDYLGCPCEIIPAGTELEKIMNIYDDLYAKREQGGFVPMIFGLDGYFERDFDEWEPLEEYKKEVMSENPTIPEEWLRQRIKENREFYTADEWKERIGAVTGGEENRVFGGLMDYNTRKSVECVIAKIPVKNPWEVFAWVPFGGWNECPTNDEIMYIAKYWYEKYGAIPAVMTHDILEFAARPVKDQTAAMDLALEQYVFCSDIVDQGLNTIGALADTLMKSSVWYFWWD